MAPFNGAPFSEGFGWIAVCVSPKARAFFYTQAAKILLKQASFEHIRPDSDGLSFGASISMSSTEPIIIGQPTDDARRARHERADKIEDKSYTVRQFNSRLLSLSPLVSA